MNELLTVELGSEMQLGEWLTYWFETYAKRTVKQSTAVSYIGYINNHISPNIGVYRLSELNTDILQRFFNAEYDNGSKKGGGLSAKTVHNIELMLHKSLAKAVDLELIRRNFAESVELPKSVSPEMRVLSVIEQQQLMSVLKYSEERYAVGVWLSLATGMRIGEVLGLQWRDIDFTERKLYIRRTVNRLKKVDSCTDSKKTEIVVGTTKSAKSVRDIPFNAAVEEFLKNYKKLSMKNMNVRQLGSTDFVVAFSRGKPAEPKSLQKCFRRIAESAGISGASFHSLRHTFATRAIEKGVDVKTLSILLGHADVGTTLNRYAHVLDEQKRKTMDVLLADF